jgi:hypothetical protein
LSQRKAASGLLALGLAGVRCQHLVERGGESTELRQWLIASDVAPLRFFAANDAALRVPRQAQLPGYPLDAPALDQKRVPDWS